MPVSSTKTRSLGSICRTRSQKTARSSRMSARSCSLARSVFFYATARTAAGLGTASALGARLLAPEVHRRETDAKAPGDDCRRQTSFPSQQHPLPQVGRIGLGHPRLLSRPKCLLSTHEQDAFQTQTKTALIPGSTGNIIWPEFLLIGYPNNRGQVIDSTRPL